jgi:CRP/FNR family transcriptional regulator, cyclic AMP receptor protein
MVGMHHDEGREEPPFLERLSEDAARSLHELGGRRRFPSGATLFVEGDAAHEAVVLLSGTLKISVAAADGREVVLDVFEPGALVGELSVIDGRPRSATVSALEPVEVLVVAADRFNEYLDRHPEVLRLLLVDVISRFRTRVRHQLEFGAGDALGRVCARLVELVDRYGEPRGDAIVLRSPVTQSELAAWTGLSREAVVKALGALRRLGWIDSQARTITILDMDLLRQRAAG